MAGRAVRVSMHAIGRFDAAGGLENPSNAAFERMRTGNRPTDRPSRTAGGNVSGRISGEQHPREDPPPSRLVYLRPMTEAARPPAPLVPPPGASAGASCGATCAPASCAC